MKKIVFFVFFLLPSSFFPYRSHAEPNLTAVVNMDIRAATAAAAKKEATDSAVRAAVMQVLSRYSDRAAVENLVVGADDSAMQNMVAATSISNEKSSKTAYGAKFSITLDRAAVDKWYEDNNVLAFIAAADESRERMIISVELPNGLSDWAELNKILRDDGNGCGLTMRSIFRTSATAYILTNKKRKFQNAVASAGWSVSNRDGILRVAKHN